MPPPQQLKKDKEPLSSLTEGKASILLAAGGNIVYKNVDATSESSASQSSGDSPRDSYPSGTSTPHSHSTTSLDSVGPTVAATATVKKTSPPSTPTLSSVSSMSSGKASITIPAKQSTTSLEPPTTTTTTNTTTNTTPRTVSPAPQKGRNVHHTEGGSSLSSGNASIIVLPKATGSAATDSPVATTPAALPSPSSVSSGKRYDYFDSNTTTTTTIASSSSPSNSAVTLTTNAPTDITIESMAAVVAAATKLSSSPQGKLSSLTMGNASILTTVSGSTSPKPQPKRSASVHGSRIFGNPFRRQNSDGAPGIEETAPELENHYYNPDAVAANRNSSTAVEALSSSSPPPAPSSPTTASSTPRSSFFRFGRKDTAPAVDDAKKKEEEAAAAAAAAAAAEAEAAAAAAVGNSTLVDESRADLEYRGIMVKEIKTTLKTMVIPEDVANPMPSVKLERPSNARVIY